MKDKKQVIRNKREFLSGDIEDNIFIASYVTLLNYRLNSKQAWSDLDSGLQISDGRSSIYLDVNVHDKKSLNKTVSRLRSVIKHIDQFMWDIEDGFELFTQDNKAAEKKTKEDAFVAAKKSDKTKKTKNANKS